MTTRTDYIRPLDFKQGRVDMTHGAGGRTSAQLIDELFARARAVIPGGVDRRDAGRFRLGLVGYVHLCSPGRIDPPCTEI